MTSLAATGAGSVISSAPSTPPRGTVTVIAPGLQATVQDLPGRGGYWDVGVPPSGAWDELSFALSNLAVGNPAGAAGIESVLTGPVLRFDQRSLICLTGAAFRATLDGTPVRPGVVTSVPTGGVLDIGPCGEPGMRAYLAVAGGIAVAPELGSRSTFLLGQFGGHDGRALAAGDQLPIGSPENTTAPMDVGPLLPALTADWILRVIPGPHGAPEHLTAEGVAALWAATWTVDHRADRTGIRLAGPAPGWARADGGEAGLHPSNIHDSAYPVGGIMLAGDTPVIVGPDGPSLGGFVVPCAVIAADLWKLGQLRPGDRVSLQPVSADEAARCRASLDAILADPRIALAGIFERSRRRAPATPAATRPAISAVPPASSHGDLPAGDLPGGDLFSAGLLAELPAGGDRPRVTMRRAGDAHLLLEAGPGVLDLTVRMWVHLLAERLRADRPPGVTEIVEGVRSMLVKTDPGRLALGHLAHRLSELAGQVPDPAGVELAVREVTLPIALDHPLAHEAMARYVRAVRPDAPWCPDNVEFIRRINDLDERDDVFTVITEATYLVVGLGDVYLGAPVAVPIDPRHRLVTTKYDPARTWTPQNAVGIGGVYLCVYGMEGPGGYQLVGRTVPVWRLLPSRDRAAPESPWLLRPFDRLRFRPVSADELADLRADIHAGRADLETRPATFSLAEEHRLLAEHADEITAFRARREAAFHAERTAWAVSARMP